MRTIYSITTFKANNLDKKNQGQREPGED